MLHDLRSVDSFAKMTVVWPDAPAQPDNDPMDRFGHGTHVAGIIAGKSDQLVSYFVTTVS